MESTTFFPLSTLDVELSGIGHEFQEILTFTISALLIPVNGILIAALSRRQTISQPITWLFIHTAFFDILFLLMRISLLLDHGKSHESEPNCRGIDLILLILENTSEIASSFMTSVVAVIRAVAIWRSKRAIYTNFSMRTVAVLISGVSLISLIFSSIFMSVSCSNSISCKDVDSTLTLVHALGQVLLVDLCVFISYTYASVAIFRSYKATRCPSAKRRSHLRTLAFIIPYTILYTALTTPSHIIMIFHNECGPENAKIDNLLNATWLVAVMGLNPLLLYACNKSLRESAVAIITSLRRGNQRISQMNEEKSPVDAQDVQKV